MKYIAAYALLALSGKENISADDMSHLLGDMGVTVEKQPIENIVNALQGMPIDQAISQGLQKL